MKHNLKKMLLEWRFRREGEYARGTTSRNLRKSAEDYTTGEISVHC